jgi:hypothetical protein
MVQKCFWTVILSNGHPYPPLHQPTFAEHSRNIRGTFAEHSRNIRGTFAEHWGNIRGTFREHWGNIHPTWLRLGGISRHLLISVKRSEHVHRRRRNHHHRRRCQLCTIVTPTHQSAHFVLYREHGNIQGTFREHSGNIQGTFREHGNIQGTFTMWICTFWDHSHMHVLGLFTYAHLETRHKVDMHILGSFTMWICTTWDHS